MRTSVTHTNSRSLTWKVIPGLMALVAAGFGLLSGCGRDESLIENLMSETVISELRQMQASSASSPEHLAEIAETEAECMRLAGWESFLPTAPAVGPTFEAATDDAHGTKPFINRYGFGMLTRLEIDAFTMPGEDPNAALLDTLDNTQREELESSLSSCAVEAVNSVSAPDMVNLSPETVTFLADIYERAASDAEVTAKAGDWAGCMRSFGHEYGTREEMFAELGEAAERFAGPFMSALNVHLGGQDWESADGLRMRDVLADDEYSEYLKAYDREVRLAQADSTCGASTEQRYQQTVERLILEAVG